MPPEYAHDPAPVAVTTAPLTEILNGITRVVVVDPPAATVVVALSECVVVVELLITDVEVELVACDVVVVSFGLGPSNAYKPSSR